MKNKKYFYPKITFLLCLLFITAVGCERELSDDVEIATFGTNPEVYIDGFSGGLEYYPYADSKFDAFTVEEGIIYEGTSSMRFDVPNVGDPDGAYAGAIFRDDNGGRDLSGYDALTFWAKATKSAVINDIGFGQDFGENKYQVSLQAMQISTGWKKYIIPIPDASKLTQEAGMFWYAEGPEGPIGSEVGYTFWIDNLRYEKLGTIAQPRPKMFNGEDRIETSFTGGKIQITGLTQTYNLASGQNQTVVAAGHYFKFSTSDVSVATVTRAGLIAVVGEGTADITATLNGVEVSGSLSITSLGQFVPAETPTANASNVISIFSDAYTNEPVEYYNGYWAPFQTTLGQDDISINGDNIIKYSALNFVGIQFTQPTINMSDMTNFHIDIQVINELDSSDFVTIKLQDIGPDNTFGTSDDSAAEIRFSASNLVTGEWVSIDIPLSTLSSLTSRSNLAQVVFISDATVTDMYVDNVYFNK
jgi:hypothetical protein